MTTTKPPGSQGPRNTLDMPSSWPNEYWRCRAICRPRVASAMTTGRAALSAAATTSAYGIIPVSMPGMVTQGADIPARISIMQARRSALLRLSSWHSIFNWADEDCPRLNVDHQGDLSDQVVGHRTAYRITDRYVRLHGGYGYSREYLVGNAWGR